MKSVRIMKKVLKTLMLGLPLAFIAVSCSEDGPADSPFNSDGNMPSFSQGVVEWHGEKAEDSGDDKVGTDSRYYHELSTFNNKVTVEFEGAIARVTSDYSRFISHVDGAYVTLDFASKGAVGVEVVVRGNTTDGALKIYGDSKFKLTLDGVSIESKRGPAINNQCKKRMFVVLTPGSSNFLADCSDYSADTYYIADASNSTEDRKGCFFSEGEMIFSGAGSLEVKGRYRHGIAADSYMVMRPGVTLAVTETAKNCIHLKGETKENIGFRMMGGYLYGMTAAPAGKCLKTDLNIIVEGGRMVLNTTGDGEYDSEAGDTSAAACLKADTSIEILGGDHAFRSTGKGGKGINAGTDLTIAGGTVGVSASGTKYSYSSTLTSAAKAVKATGNIFLTGGDITVLATGESENGKAIESDSRIEVSGGRYKVYSYDDALKSPEISISDNTSLWAYSVMKDAIDAKSLLDISGGNITAIGGTSAGIKCEAPSSFRITGGTVVAMGGSLPHPPSGKGVPWCVWKNLKAQKGDILTVSDGTSALYSFMMPRTMRNGTLLVADEKLKSSSSLSVLINNKPCADIAK